MNILVRIIIVLSLLLTTSLGTYTFTQGQLLGALNQASSASSNAARIQCEYKDIDGESLVLNCTLVMGLSSSSSIVDSSVVAGVLVNSLEQGMSSSGPGSSSHLNIRVGIDRHWRTPWEQLSINHNIIRTLIWRNSRLTEIGPYAFRDLTSIQRLDLSNNRLTDLNSSALGQLEVDLIDLDLSHNLFTHMPGELFENNKRVSRSLETLRMNENPIAMVTRRPFQALRSSLRLIELNYCQIRAIETDAFEGMRQLESISLIGNHLRHLNQQTFVDLTLRSFYVHENPLVCDCHMRWLIDYLKTVDFQQQNYESQLTVMSTTRRFNINSMNLLPEMNSRQSSSSSYMGGTMSAAQSALRCDQPNSLKSKPNFLDINPDSFMCDIQLSFRDNVNESTYELGEDAVLVCDVYGDPEPDVYWSFGQRPIEKALSNELDKYYVTEMRGESSFAGNKVHSSRFQMQSHHYLSNKTSELRIRDLQPSDMGLYTCTAEIKGSNNRKQIVFSVKQIKRAATSLSNAGDMFLNGVNSLLTQMLNFIYNLAGLQSSGYSGSNKQPFNSQTPAQMANISSTLALLFSILISICVFLCIICVFVCWRLRCCCCCRKRGRGQKHRQLSKSDMMKHMALGNSSEDLMQKEQQEKLLISAGGGGGSMGGGGKDSLDHHESQSRQNYVSLVNDSSATLLSASNGVHNTKASNSIRMAYPNYSNATQQQQHNHLNDIYANHSLLTTTSSATCVSSAYPVGPLPPPPPPPPPPHHHAIAIDTSNHTPRYHLLQQQQQQHQQQIDCYYDDLRYNGDELPINRMSPNMNPSVIYSSPYRHNPNLANPAQSYSPIIRRDDPTVPLYATLKPKLIHQQQQHQAQITRNLNNYVHYSTIHRTQNATTTAPPMAKPRQFVTNGAAYSIHPHHHHHQMLPPPPPPPPAPVPPVKPKRTFEYVVMGTTAAVAAAREADPELNSESGAFLLDHTSMPSNNINENELGNKLKLKAKNRKKTKHYQYKDQGSTTSLDEDLDLNDLKDFEDVTFDNLRKPGEDPKTAAQQLQQQSQPKPQPQKQQHAIQAAQTVLKPTTEAETTSEIVLPKYKNKLSIRMQDLKQDTNSEHNSEQSLLLKSSSSSESKCSSDNTINNICAASNSTNTTSATNASNELRSSSEINAAATSSGSSSSSSSGSNVQIEEQATIQATTGGGKVENNLMENVVDELSSKIYEETEI